MHYSRFCAVIIDCQTGDPHEGARFWGAAFGRSPMPPSEAGSKYVQLATKPGELKIEVQAVTHESRAHLDIETDDIEAEVKRLVALGATEVERIRTWAVMRAPTGQKFCVVRPQTSLEELVQNGNRWE